jgi:hypothetical protein
MATARLGQMVPLSPRRLAEQPLRRSDKNPDVHDHDSTPGRRNDVAATVAAAHCHESLSVSHSGSLRLAAHGLRVKWRGFKRLAITSLCHESLSLSQPEARGPRLQVARFQATRYHDHESPSLSRPEARGFKWR